MAQAVIPQIPSQTWAQAMQSPDANLYDVQEKFYAYWAGKDITQKGKGYKAFKRWESFTAPRVYPSGQVGLLNQNSKNYNDFLISTYGPQAPQNGGGKAGGGNLIASTTWTPMGPFGPLTGSAGGQLNKNGRMCFITIDPTNTLNLWVGAPAGGLWKTTNGGTNWTTNTDNLGVIGCSDLAIDPITPANMYLATGDGDAGDTKSIGVLKSTDGGTTWNATALVFPVGNSTLIRRLIINPTNPLILMAATSSGIYRTTNGGTSWAMVQASNCYDLEFQPTNPLVVYAAGATFRRSTDGGATWTQIGGVMPTSGVTRMAIAVTTADINRVYVLAGNNTDSGMLGIYQSTDAGVTFSSITPGGGINVLGWNSNGLDLGGQDWYDLAIASSPLNADEVVTGGVNIWRRTAPGNTWALYGHWTGSGAPFIHADHHDLEYDAAGNLYGTNDGTVYKRTGATWTEISGNSFNISQIYKIGTSALTANKWITGHQDNGTNIWTGATYTCSIGGDGMDCFIDRTNDANMFGETYNGSFRRSTNGGANWAGYTTGMSGAAPWVSIWKQDPQTANTIYGGYQNLFKSILSTGTWTMLAALPGGGNVNEFAVAPSNSLIIYVLKNAAVYKTINGGTSWTTVNTGITFGGAPTFITICPTDPNKAWITLSGYSPGNKVFQTINGGTNWTNFSANLPNLPANCSVYQPASADRIYVGMDIGVYYRDNVSANWTLYNTGLPNVPLSDMEISPADPTKLIAATYGRGVWKVDLIANLAPVASFSFSGNTCTGSPVVFTDLSANGPTSWSWSVTPAAGVVINTPASQNPTITFANPGNYTVSLISTNLLGSSPVLSQTLTITTTPTIAVTSSVQTICSGATTIITASGAGSYTWTGGPLTNTISVTPLITTIYTVTGASGVCLSAPKTATVNTNPSPTVSVNSPSICIGSNTIITANGAASYSWSNGPVTNTISVSPTLTTVYTVTGTSAGCTNVRTATVTVNSTPTVAVTNSVQTICAGSTIIITASGAASYTWTAGPLTNTISVTPLSTTVYTVTGANGNCANIKTATVNVNPLPVINASANTTLLCNGDVVTLNSSGASSYTWQPGNLNGPTVTDNPGSSTVYTCSGTDVNGCVGTSTILITVSSCNGILQNGAEAVVFNVFPNPASENITISYPSKNSAEINIEVMDAAGKLVIKKSQVFNKNNPNLNINISNVAKGVYFLKLIPKEGNAKTVKLVKE